MSIATTGIAGLDAQLGGGVPRGTTLLLVGEPGNAIPLFSEQFAGGGLDVGDDVHYFQFDRPLGGLRKAVQRFVMRGGEGKAQLTLHDGYTTRFAHLKRPGRLLDAQAAPVPPGEVGDALLAALAQQNAARPYRLVVETLTTMGEGASERELFDLMRTLVYLGQESGGLHLVSIVKGAHSAAFETQMRHIATGVIEFGAERKGFGIYNYLVVSKLLDVVDPVKILLWKETDKGLWLESTKRVF